MIDRTFYTKKDGKTIKVDKAKNQIKKEAEAPLPDKKNGGK